jgi:starch synthase (maltosyl-transferring)
MGRIVIDTVRPRTPTGQYPAKAVVGRTLRVTADVFKEGHDVLAARVRIRPTSDKKWQQATMRLVENDEWEATVTPTTLGLHELQVEAWTDRWGTWRHDVSVKHAAGQNVELELEEGAQLLDAAAKRVAKADRVRLAEIAARLRDADLPDEDRIIPAVDGDLADLLADLPDPADHTKSAPQLLWVDRERAAIGAWYELFPRSYGGLRGATDRLDAVAAMGFDVVYLPPVHPIGVQFRKGRNNTLTPEPNDPGSPWAIGSAEGGHTDVDPNLGTIDDFDAFVARARQCGLEVALDYALQCSPDHPWVTQHPEWFHHRPDGTIKYAENPPKKYQDIYPINFWPQAEGDRVELWTACYDILAYWIAHGVRVFRVDNPHTKPFAFWEWIIPKVQQDYPDAVFLAEAFTRPKLMAKLAEIGFSQSYTYFTWRTTKTEFVEYLTEIAHGPKADFMRPNFWPNTPDILSGPLRNGAPGVFKHRLVLAATLSPSYGIYSGYELCENEPASDTNEEYLHSEKYEIKRRNFDDPRSLAPYITRVNEVRRRHPALSELANLRFHHSNNEWILAYSKHTDDRSDVILTVVNLDPHAVQEDTLWIDLAALGLPWEGVYEAIDELTGVIYYWNGPSPYIRLDPSDPAHILHLRTH